EELAEAGPSRAGGGRLGGGGHAVRGPTGGHAVRRWLVLACSALVALAGCTSSAHRSAGRTGPRPVVVASFDFPESVVLAQLYGQALRDRGYPVEILPNAGTREILEPALS